MTLELTDYEAPPQRRRANARPSKTVQPAAKKVHPYYDYGPLLSHNAEYNFVVGGRGLGKTYGAKKRAVTRAIRNDEMFIYLRRHKEELSGARDTFFTDFEHEFPEWDFRVLGNTFQMAPVSTQDAKKREWTDIGYAVALSKTQAKKSVSYPRVKTIIFDEFIIEKGLINYIPNEPVAFNNFYSTVDRWLDKTKVFFLANAVNLGNPYFVHYNIEPDTGQEWMKLDVGKAKGYVLVHFPEAKEFQESVLQTRFGQMIDGSEYADYAVGNQFKDNTLALIGVKNPRARHMFNFETTSGTFSLWHDVIIDEYYVQSHVPPGQRTVTMVMELMSEDKTLLLPSDKLVKNLVSAFRHKKMKFENKLVRSRWIEVMQKIA